MNKKLIFIRDDDLYKKDRVFLKICEFLLEKRIPVSYAVIPGKLQKGLIAYLKRKKGLHPELIDILQHGWRHTNYSPNLKDKYEFGPRRSYARQKTDILKGLNKLKKSFEDDFLPCFVPPYHGYNPTTLKILRELEIPLFSAGAPFTTRCFGLKQLAAEVSLNDYAGEGRPLCIPFEAMVRRFLYHLNRGGPFLGLVFHHQAIKKEKDLKELFKFLLFLKKMEHKKYLSLVRITKAG